MKQFEISSFVSVDSLQRHLKFLKHLKTSVFFQIVYFLVFIQFQQFHHVTPVNLFVFVSRVGTISLLCFFSCKTICVLSSSKDVCTRQCHYSSRITHCCILQLKLRSLNWARIFATFLSDLKRIFCAIFFLAPTLASYRHNLWLLLYDTNKKLIKCKNREGMKHRKRKFCWIIFGCWRPKFALFKREETSWKEYEMKICLQFSFDE